MTHEAPALSTTATAAERRAILLGASNLALGFHDVLQAAVGHLGGPLEVHMALGHGRSYGQGSQVLMRWLPSILSCGLWEDLDRRPRLPGAALLTDIGNDLLYEVEDGQVAEWIEICVDRLAGFGIRGVLVGLPVANLDRLSPMRFQFFRRLFFPFCRLSLGELARRAYALDERLRGIAERRRLPFATPQAAWYGFDPIHIRSAQRRAAWDALLALWRDFGADFEASSKKIFEPRAGRLIGRPRIHRRRWFGRDWNTAQPSAHWSDGSPIAFY